MTLGVFRSLAALLVLGNALLRIPSPRRFVTELLQAAPATALHERRVLILVAGDATVATASQPPSTVAPAGTDDFLASAVAHGRELLLQGSLREAADVLDGVLASQHDEPSALLHLAEVLAQLGQLRRATVLVDRLLSLGRLTPEARSFMFNRRGNYLKSATDWTGARKSYELALEEGGYGHSVNRHALWNLASLLHFHIFPSETAGQGLSTLERAIELYLAALGRDGSTPAHDSTPSDLRGKKQGDDIGGPVDHLSILRDLAGALLLAGRPEEAVAELEYFLAGTLTKSKSSWSRSSNASSNRNERGNSDDSNGANPVGAVATADAAAMTKSRAFLWDSLSGARVAAGDVSGAVAAGQ